MRLGIIFVAALSFAQTRESIEAQMKAVEQQRESVRKMLPPLRTPQASADCDALPEETVAPLIESAAKERKLPAKLVRAVAERESGLRACSVSEKGAQGLMQLMPDTAEQFQVKDAFDPKQNLSGGAAYLRQLLEKYKGDLALSLAAYNAGPDTVDKIAAVPDIPETKAYVEAIVAKMGVKQIELPALPKP